MNIAILGLGAIAGQMAKAISFNPEAAAYACASRDLDRAQKFAREYGFQKAYGSYEELLQDPAVELVYIAVPHALHADCAIRCLQAGKHVLLEKPFTATQKQAQQVIDLSREKNLFAGEGMWMKYLPMCTTIKELSENGTIGEINAMHGSIGYCLTQERLFDPEMAGGALLDVGCYTLALAGLIFGYEVEQIRSWAALTDRGIDASHGYTLQYKRNQKSASFTNSIVSRGGCTTEIRGTKGCLIIDTTNNLARVTVLDSTGKAVRTIDRQPWQNSYQYELASALASIREGRLDTPECPHNEILARMDQMDTMRRQWGMVYPFEKEAPKRTIHVAAAVIRQEDKIFATARGYGDWKGWWEFPGGKLEAGETAEQALVREIREELDTEILVGERIDTVEYDYPAFHLSMDCFWCTVVRGELELKEAQEARWLTKDTLDSVRWLPADITLIEKIRCLL